MRRMKKQILIDINKDRLFSIARMINKQRQRHNQVESGDINKPKRRMQDNKRINITTNDSDIKGKQLSFFFRFDFVQDSHGPEREVDWSAWSTWAIVESERYAEASRRSRGRRNRRRERRRRGIVDEIERERRIRLGRCGIVNQREREATIPPIETSVDAVDEEISSSRRDLRFAFGVALREREKRRH